MPLSFDSARDKDTVANIVPSKKVSRTPAVSSFMVLFLLWAPALSFSCLPRYRILTGASRFGSGRDTAHGFEGGQVESLGECPRRPPILAEKSNRTVTFRLRLCLWGTTLRLQLIRDYRTKGL